MNPVITVEFSAKTDVAEIKEESVSLHSTEELFAFVAPGGGCDKILIGLPGMHQELMLLTKDERGDIHIESLLGVVFVPLLRIKKLSSFIE
ncbi:MAG: hypothetical protein OEY78_09375 [Gammaproteobacteria bacterium]|nr:hypothetical protein [Gammaproteobacteria bacterium]